MISTWLDGVSNSLSFLHYGKDELMHVFHKNTILLLFCGKEDGGLQEFATLLFHPEIRNFIRNVISKFMCKFNVYLHGNVVRGVARNLGILLHNHAKVYNGTPKSMCLQARENNENKLHT